MSYEIVEEAVHTDDGSFGSWIQERTSSTSNSSKGDSVLNPTKTIIRRHGKETTADNRRRKNFQKCLNLKSSMSQSEDNRKAVKHLFIKTKLTDHSSDYSLCGGYTTSTSNSSSNSSSASFGLETFHGSDEQYNQNYQTAAGLQTATGTPRTHENKSGEFQTNTNNKTDTETEAEHSNNTIINTKPEPEVSPSTWSNHHENSTKFQTSVKNLLEYKQKFPKIKKSLLYSNSPEFAEYARLLRELSPLSAPTTIYFLYDPVENVYSGKFSLYNKSGVRAAFKIKSSSSKGSYIVSPHWGFIDSKQEMKIFVQVRPRKKSIRNSDFTTSTTAAKKDIITTDNPKRPQEESKSKNTKVKANQNLNRFLDVETLDAENNLYGTNTSQPKIFKHAALGVFTARVDPALNLNLQDAADIGKFWEYYEASNQNMIAGHFLKRLLVVQHNGDIHFKTCTHNIFDSIMSQPLQASHKKHKRGKEEISMSTSKMNFSTNDDQLRSLQLYNSLLLEILVSRKTMTEYILKFQILHFILFILIGLIFLRVFDFI